MSETAERTGVAEGSVRVHNSEAAKLRTEWSDGNPGVALDFDSTGTLPEVDPVQATTYEDIIGESLWRCSTPASPLCPRAFVHAVQCLSGRQANNGGTAGLTMPMIAARDAFKEHSYCRCRNSQEHVALQQHEQ